MNADRAQVLELLAQCRSDLEACERSVKEVALLTAACPVPADGSGEVILYGYRLHQWYSAAENLLSRIAVHLGNEVEKTEWQRPLQVRGRSDSIARRDSPRCASGPRKLWSQFQGLGAA